MYIYHYHLSYVKHVYVCSTCITTNISRPGSSTDLWSEVKKMDEGKCSSSENIIHVMYIYIFFYLYSKILSKMRIISTKVCNLTKVHTFSHFRHLCDFALSSRRFPLDRQCKSVVAALHCRLLEKLCWYGRDDFVQYTE